MLCFCTEMVALSQTFRNRVDLQDRQMKDGDVSLTLKDVTVNDTGTYQTDHKRSEGQLETGERLDSDQMEEMSPVKLWEGL
ncbi:unnamed protein product [Menidia menidia]|uniref:(Atlantic silverside) hypothetical protein n=1 Tax=Menidia menidia TaxID=238744 RepID=A0A8S4BXS3_9TELE|nr:unnamed protein product [Menidia menidia]